MTSQQMNINTKIEMIKKKKKNQMEILEVKSIIRGKKITKEAQCWVQTVRRKNEQI